jgi:lipoate---protein ligase
MMKPVWRLLKGWDRMVSTAEGLAVDDMMAYSISETGSAPILHLYRFKPSAIVGKYQDIEAALKIDRCRELGVEFNRRSTGGGTVIMGEKVVALGFGIPLDYGVMGRGIDAVFAKMSAVLLRALNELGVPAEFRPKNDLQVNGKKIAGLSASAEVGSCLLFHCSMLVDFDIPLMLQIMNTPSEKLYDKGYSCFSQRLTTIQQELGREVSIGEVMKTILSSFEHEFQVEFASDSLTEWERAKVEQLKAERYTGDEWIFSHKHPRSRMGEALLKTPGGLLQIYLSLAGGVIDQVVITGDFFSTSEDINRIESVLKWTPAKWDRIMENLSTVWKDGVIYGVTREDLAQTILDAKERMIAAA